jgi:hypothetical protein
VFSENEWAFDLLYCVAFVVMDKQWLERNATYMEFNVRIYTIYFVPFVFIEIHGLVLFTSIPILRGHFNSNFMNPSKTLSLLYVYVLGYLKIYSSSGGERTSNG